MKTFKQYILENQQEPVIDGKGNKIWYNENGQLHRDNDLPAVEYANGIREWYKNGRYHRDSDLPAIEWGGGDKWWYKNGNLHREQDKPAIEYANGDKEWWKNNKHHREQDKPAVDYVNGNKDWYKNGERHRETGPAIISPDKPPRYFLNGKEYTKEEFEAEMRRRKMMDAYKRGDTDRNVADDLGDLGHVI